MTTIAYRRGVLASDSLVTCNGLRDGYAQKIYRVGPLLVAGAGSAAICTRFVEWVRAGMKGESPWYGEDSGNSMIITPEDQIVVWGSSGSWVSDSDFYALGSGERLALGAMAYGASAEEAVECAIRFDVYSGGPIKTVRREFVE